MKHFVDLSTRIASGHENYVEFQLPAAAVEFWDPTSLYMLETEMADTGFASFWSNCVLDNIVFDMDSFTKEELSQMLEAAQPCGGTVLSVLNELWKWVNAKLSESNQRIGVVWAPDRAMARWRELREAYPKDPRFLDEVQAIDEELNFSEQQEEYERLLLKYNMPKYFFSFPLDEPTNW